MGPSSRHGHIGRRDPEPNADGEERRRAVCGRTSCTDRGGGGRKPGQSGSICRTAGRLSPTLLAGFGDAPLVAPGSELQLTIDGGAVRHDEVLAELHEVSRASARETPAVEV